MSFQSCVFVVVVFVVVMFVVGVGCNVNCEKKTENLTYGRENMWVI